MGTGTKIALILGGIAVVGVSAYFIIKSVKKANEKKEAEKKAAEQNVVRDDFKLRNLGYDPKNPLGMKQKGGLNNITLYDKDAFKKSMSDITNQLPKTYDPNFMAKYDPNYVPKYDPNFLANLRPLVIKPFSI